MKESCPTNHQAIEVVIVCASSKEGGEVYSSLLTKELESGWNECKTFGLELWKHQTNGKNHKTYMSRGHRSMHAYGHKRALEDLKVGKSVHSYRWDNFMLVIRKNGWCVHHQASFARRIKGMLRMLKWSLAREVWETEEGHLRGSYMNLLDACAVWIKTNSSMAGLGLWLIKWNAVALKSKMLFKKLPLWSDMKTCHLEEFHLCHLFSHTVSNHCTLFHSWLLLVVVVVSYHLQWCKKENKTVIYGSRIV